MRKNLIWAAFFVIVLCFSTSPPLGAGGPQQSGDYYSMQFTNWPPLPANILGLEAVEIAPGLFLMNDLDVNYDELNQFADLMASVPGPPGGGGGTNGSGLTEGGEYGPIFSFIGSCAGHLLLPIQQITNLILTVVSNQSSDSYDLYTVSNLNVTNWTWLARGTNGQTTFVVTNPPIAESYYTVGCIDDNDGEGLSDVYEVLVTHTNPDNPDTDYDGRSDYEELLENTLPLDLASFTAMRLAFFRFNDTNWYGDRLQKPIVATNLQSGDGWITKAVQLTNWSSMLKYRSVEPDGKANLNLRSGTVSCWFKPLWTSGTGTVLLLN